ncbi:unnamed protein product [Allacma fusca]|uniref:Serine aminopeptidase S33 domain-containing protein n=1 Tax=Allacma fusca TaxID=39272 RepID=A0A8J2L4T6_9HEXA|nr:unnamed protein product [Allacma fusca]
MEFNNLVYLASAASTITAILATYFYLRASHSQEYKGYTSHGSADKKPTICTSNKKLRNFLESHVPALFEKYSPSWLFWEGRLQSIMGLALRLPESKKLPYMREIFQLSDGGELGLDYLDPPEGLGVQGSKGRKKKANRKLLVLLLPGLTSSSQTSYVKSVALAITHAGATVVVLNNRGLGGVPLKTPRTYCASKPDDAREVIAHLKKKYPCTRLMAVGTSLGGILLCQYLINYAQEAKQTLIAALVISICWDPMSGTTNLEKPFVNKYIMNYNLTQNLRSLAAKYRKILEERNCWDFNKVLKSRTLREFDAHFTAPQFGYESVMDYYKDASVIDNIDKFPIPVFGFNAYDDPLQPGDRKS